MKYTITEHLIGILCGIGILFMLYWIMYFFHKFVCFIKKETWWRNRYKRVTHKVGSTDIFYKCNLCDAGDAPKHLRCDMLRERDCPCKYNQYLKYK